jgi:hypothetical protein
MQHQTWGGFSAPHFLFPLEPHARLERSPENLRWLGEQMSERRTVHLVLALWDKQIEVLEVSHFLPATLWLEGCVPVLLEPHELGAYCTGGDYQLELVQHLAGVFEVRWLAFG